MTKETKIIAPAHLHKYVYMNLLKEQQSTILLGTKLETFEQILNQNVEIEPVEEFYHVYQALQQLPIQQLKPMLEYPSFVQQLYDVYQQFILYNIQFPTLPDDTSIEKEIKKILLFLDSLPLTIHQKVQNIQQFSAENYQIMDTYSSSIFEQRCYQKWLSKASAYPLPTTQKPKVFLGKAQNHRQEIESIFQYIIQNQYQLNDIQLVLLEPSYIHHVQQIAKRYHMPIDAPSFLEPSLFAQKMLAALTFIEHPTYDNLLHLCNQHFFLCDTQDFYQYILKQPHSPQECLQPFIALQKITQSYFDITILQETERLAEEQRQKIQDILSKLVCEENYISKIQYAFHYLLNDPILHDEQEIKVYQRIKDVLEILLSNHAPLPLILYEIKKIRKHRAEVQTDAITITTLDTLLPGYPVTIVVGCSQDNFPNIHEYVGIIDESYLAKIPEFPTLNQRAEHYFQQAEKMYNISKEIYFSYSCSNLQGKAFELSIEIEKRYGKDVTAWPLLQIHQNHSIDHSISENTAKSLFLNKDHKLVGSVSSLEQYQNCNYAYFLEKGLSIQEPLTLEMDHRIMGTIQHAIVEYFVAQEKEVTKEEVHQFLEPLFLDLLPLFPQKQDYLFTLQKQLVERFTQRLSDIQQSVKDGIMKPTHFEQRIYDTIPVNPYPIELRGIIDRIDTSDEYFRIIDYKSSKKELSDVKFHAGLQLQLITYLLVATKMLQKRPYGAYYQSVKIENTECSMYGPKDKETKQYIPMNNHLLQQNYVKNQAAKGWRVEILDQDAFVQKEYFQYKDKDIKELEQILLSIYADISKNITDGQIAPNPTENTCSYCPYLSICRYHGETRKFSSKGGVKEDA